MEIKEIQLALSDDGVQFGPSAWKIDYAEYSGAGTAQGQLKWAPTLATDVSFSTDPLTIRQWKQIRASGKLNFDKGILGSRISARNKAKVKSCIGGDFG
jgi:hypothetical protein